MNELIQGISFGLIAVFYMSLGMRIIKLKQRVEMLEIRLNNGGWKEGSFVLAEGGKGGFASTLASLHEQECKWCQMGGSVSDKCKVKNE
ncbi:hypothetical protein YTPLAS21_19410 [Candidatus Nitrosocosmicus sp.]|nr:hypothetical protein YTPLAS21_19410 [Candidatus Nitrosocosmicus sp.]